MALSLIQGFVAPLLGLPHLITVLAIAFFLSLLMTLLYKWTTDQAVLKSLREDLKTYQKQMKETQESSQLFALQKKAMNTNMQYLLHSLRPTLFTMVPLLLVFSWLAAHFAYEPLYPQQEFSVVAHAQDGITGAATLDVSPPLPVDNQLQHAENGRYSWKLKGEEGTYLATITVNDNAYEKEVIISPKQIYAAPEKKINDGVIKTIEVPMKKLVFVNLLGWQMGWLGAYVLSSLVCTILLRKMFGVY